jgi:hypothetical protein
MVQNYAWTHRNPARYHSTTRLIIIPLYFFCLEVRSFRRFFSCGPGVAAFLLDGLVVQDLPYTEIHAKFQNWRLEHCRYVRYVLSICWTELCRVIFRYFEILIDFHLLPVSGMAMLSIVSSASAIFSMMEYNFWPEYWNHRCSSVAFACFRTFNYSSSAEQVVCSLFQTEPLQHFRGTSTPIVQGLWVSSPLWWCSALASKSSQCTPKQGMAMDFIWGHRNQNRR